MIDTAKIATRGELDEQVISHVIERDTYNLKALSKQIAPDVIFDIGGHIGAFGLLAKSYWPDAHLIALEPQAESYNLYLENVKRFNLNNVDILNAALSYDKERNCLAEAHTSSGGGVLIYPKEVNKLPNRYVNYGEIETYTIEDLVRKYDIINIDLAKFDCEGGEIDAFRNMKQNTAYLFDVIVGEYHIYGENYEQSTAQKEDLMTFIRMAMQKFNHLEFIINADDRGRISAINTFSLKPPSMKMPTKKIRIEG